MNGSDEAKTKFYEDLHALLASVPKADNFVVLDEFNVRVGTNCVAWIGALDPHGIVGCSDNGLLLLRICTGLCLLLTNAFLCILKREKATWTHPPLRQWHLLGYVPLRRRDQQDVLVTKAILDADGLTDHCLVISKLRSHLQSRRRPQIKRTSSTPRHTVQSTALDVFGRESHQHQDWFDDKDVVISNLLDKKSRLQKAYVNLLTDSSKAAFCRNRYLAQQRLQKV
nr:unnamed protein product [Spirometra erinaceieuropaei]